MAIYYVNANLGTITIPLTQGQTTVIDVADFELVRQYKWCAHHDHNTYYAVSQTRRVNGKRRQLRMHRLILDAPADTKIDHRDGNGLNNRRNNIRMATSVENGRNQRKQRGTTSSFKGLYWNKARGKWQASIAENGTIKHLGMFADEVTAAIAYDKAARELFGQFARCNFDSDMP